MQLVGVGVIGCGPGTASRAEGLRSCRSGTSVRAHGTSENFGVHTNADQLLDGPVETPHLNIGKPWNDFRGARVVDLRIGKRRDGPQLPPLTFSERRGKDRARGGSLFVRR